MDRDTVKSITQPLYGGNTTIDSTTSTGAIGATALLTINGAAPGCSGTLVTPTKVVSAAHCFKCPTITTAGAVSVSFAQGGGSFPLAAPPALLPGSNNDCPSPYPDAFDFAVLTLATPVPASVATPQPIFLSDSYTALIEGSLVQPCSFVGYGGDTIYNSGAGSGPRRVGSILPEWYRDTCGDVCEGPCNNSAFWREDLLSNQAHPARGDSGGGLFCTLNGAPVLIGVYSGWTSIDSFCNTEYNSIQSPTGTNDGGVRDFLIAQIGFPDVAPTAAFAVLAKGGVNINDRASVVTSNGNAGALIGARSGGRLGTDTFVGNVFANGNMQVADRARVNGTLTANGSIAIGNQVQGTFLRHRYSQLPAWDLAVTYPTTTSPAVTLEPGVQRTIGAEVAGTLISSITVDQSANLTLSCGTTYFVSNLTINAGGRISVNTSCGPARIFVRNRITNNHGEIVDLNPGFGDILVGYTGTNAVSVGALYGTLVAPRAKVTVENGISLIGAIFAGTVEVHQDSAVIHYPFNFPWVI
jgi:hypothetical protein